MNGELQAKKSPKSRDKVYADDLFEFGGGARMCEGFFGRNYVV